MNKDDKMLVWILCKICYFCEQMKDNGGQRARRLGKNLLFPTLPFTCVGVTY